MFNIPKDENGIRPIVNLSRLSKASTGAHPAKLCSVFQLIDKPIWEKDLWYVKLDFAQAFYNIPMAKAARHLLTFKVGNNFYRFRRLPFGLGCAPFICQTFLMAIVRYIRKSTPFVWGHIDDLLIAHKSSEALKDLVRKLSDKCAKAGWRLSLKKCVLTPARSVTFLGCTWCSSGITRDGETTRTLRALIATLETNPVRGEKEKQVIKGYMSYYLQFAGKVHSIVDRFVEGRDVEANASLLRELVEIDSVEFRSKAQGSLGVYADATPIKLAGMIMKDDNNIPVTLIETKNWHCSLPIIEAETRAILLALDKLVEMKRYHRFRVQVFTDSTSALFFFKRATCRFSKLDSGTIGELLVRRSRLCQYFDLDMFYVSTDLNPADYYSRH